MLLMKYLINLSKIKFWNYNIIRKLCIIFIKFIPILFMIDIITKYIIVYFLFSWKYLLYINIMFNIFIILSLILLSITFKFCIYHRLILYVSIIIYLIFIIYNTSIFILLIIPIIIVFIIILIIIYNYLHNNSAG